jgi:DNA invertase Pin-like site-specific DNA recombinase
MNCLLYARVSTDKQAQKDLSIPAQIEAMREYAKRNNWKVASHFIDEGESARTANRPELKKLIQYCKENKGVDAVVVHKIDRLARNLIDYATIKAILKQKGIRLISVSEPFDDNPVGHLLENIIASISEWYSANLGEEIKKSNMEKLRQGEWPHKPPFGYKSVKGENNRIKHIPDLEKAPLVRQLYELFSAGKYSLRILAEEMAERGLRTAYGRIYSPEAIKKLLTKRFYIGRLDWKGKEYKGKHEPIITPELFYRVQEVLKRRSAETGEKGKLDFLLRGVAYCQTCNQKLTAENHPRGNYYRCLPNLHNGDKCDEPYVPVNLLDAHLEALYERLQPPKRLLELLKSEMRDIAERRKRIAQTEIRTLKITINNLESKEMKLIDEKLEGKVSKEIYEKMQKKYSEKRREAEARLSQLEVDYEDPLDFLDKCIVIGSMLSYLHERFDFAHRKCLLKAIFEKIYVRNRAIADVKLNPPFSILFSKDIERLFEDSPSSPTKKDIFEQKEKVDKLFEDCPSLPPQKCLSRQFIPSFNNNYLSINPTSSSSKEM